MDKYFCLPSSQDSPVNFCDPRARGVYRAVPYKGVAPLSYEYPYAYSQAQETVHDRLIMASLHGFQVVRPGYFGLGDGPEGEEETLLSFQSGKAPETYILDSDVRKSYQPPDVLSVGYKGQ